MVEGGHLGHFPHAHGVAAVAVRFNLLDPLPHGLGARAQRPRDWWTLFSAPHGSAAVDLVRRRGVAREGPPLTSWGGLPPTPAAPPAAAACPLRRRRLQQRRLAPFTGGAPCVGGASSSGSSAPCAGTSASSGGGAPCFRRACSSGGDAPLLRHQLHHRRRCPLRPRRLQQQRRGTLRRHLRQQWRQCPLRRPLHDKRWRG